MVRREPSALRRRHGQLKKDGNGDCRQEIVLIGREMDQEALTAMLDDCLLTDDEISTDEKNWNIQFSDPFPEWKVEA